MRTTTYFFLGLALLSVGPVSASAQEAAATTAATTEAAPARRARRRPRQAEVVASFPGFRMNPDGTSRCSVHLSATVAATSHASGRRFEVTLPGAVVLVRNHLHPLETRFFNTPMLRARLERRGRGALAFVVELRADVTATMHVDPVQTGGVDVVVELPAGRYVEGPPQIGGSVELSQSEIDAEADARTTARDDGARTSPSGSVRPSAASSTASQPAPAARTASSSQSTQTASPAPARSSSGSTSRADLPTGEDDERPPIFDSP